MDFRNIPSTHGATSPCTRHKGAETKCCHDVSMGPKTRIMRKFGEKKVLKGLEQETSMCNDK